MTRPRDERPAGALQEGDDRLAALLRARGARPLRFPTTRILPPGDSGPLERAARAFPDYDWLVVTSARTVAPLVDALRSAGRDPSEPGPAVCAVGPSTAAALTDAGFSVDLVPERFVAEGVADGLVPQLPGTGEPRILLARAQEGRDVLPERLEAAGARVEVVPAYRTVPDRQGAERLARAVRDGEVDVLTFAAGSAARSFGAAWAGRRPPVPIVAIGPATADALEAVGLRADAVAEPHTLEALADTVGTVTGQAPR